LGRRVITKISSARNGPKEFDTWAGEEKLELESLILANQATTFDFRRLKTKSSLSKKSNSGRDRISNFGVIGQLTSSTNDRQTPDPGKPKNRSRESYSMSVPELDTKAPFKLKSFLGKSNVSNESEPEIVVMPPALTFTDSGSIVPYQTTHSTDPPATIDGSSQQLPETASGLRSIKQSTVTHISTSGALVDMLVTRMTTERGQEPMKLGKAGTQQSAIIADDEDEYPVHFFSGRARQPY
jgi:hypothetical protein